VAERARRAPTAPANARGGKRRRRNKGEHRRCNRHQLTSHVWTPF
jgi:hypothetical protein